MEQSTVRRGTARYGTARHGTVRCEPVTPVIVPEVRERVCVCVYLDSLSCPCWVPWPQPSSYIQVAWKRACGHLEQPISSQSVGGEGGWRGGGGGGFYKGGGRWLSDSVGTQLEGRTGETRVSVVEVVVVVGRRRG